MTVSNPDLIEYIARKCGCSYISDLHSKSVRAELKRALADDTLLSYPLGQWKTLSEYIVDIKPASDDVAEIRRRILDKL